MAGRVPAHTEKTTKYRFRIDWINSHPDGATVEVWAVPGASKTEISGLHDGALRVRLATPAEGGKANRALERLLKRAGYDVDSTTNGDEAVASYRAAMNSGTPYCVVIMDLTVQGGKGGAEAATEILSLDADAAMTVVS